MNGIGRGDEDRKQDKQSVFTKETAGMILLLFSALILLFAATGRYIFGDIGQMIASFCIGLGGFFIYPLLLFGLYGGVSLVAGKSFVPWRWLVRGALVVVCVFFIVHIATAERFYYDAELLTNAPYGAYLSGCFHAASEAIAQGTGGGVLFGLVAYPVRFLLSAPGAYIVFAVLTLLSLFFFLMLTPLKGMLRPVERRPREKKERPRETDFDDLDPAPRTRRDSERFSRPAAEPAEEPRGYAPDPEPVYEERTPTGRDILFANDPATNYHSNLIFNRDSAFNRNARRSSVQPAEQYSGEFSREAEVTRDPMPKRVTSEEFNYPAKPSYHAPDAPAPAPAPQPAPAPEEYSSAPSVFDIPDEPAPQRPSYLADPRPKAPETPAPAPQLAPAPSESRMPERSSRSTLRVGFGDADEPPARRLEDAPTRGAQPLGFDFGRDRRTEPARDDFSGREAPARDRREAFDSRDPFGSRGALGTDDSASRDSFSGRDTPRDSFSGRDTPRDVSDSPRETPRETFRDTPREAPRETFRDTPRETPRETFRDTPRETFRETEERDDPFRGKASSLLDDDSDEGDFHIPDASVGMPRSERGIRRTESRESSPRTSSFRTEPAPAPAEPAPAPQPQKHVWKPYKRPSVALLKDYEDKVTVSPEEIDQNSELITDTLAAFKIESQVVKVTTGATFTRYDITIPSNVAVQTVIKREEDIAMRLRVPNGVKMRANREYGTISIEVPNRKRGTVGLQSVLLADEYVHSKPNSLMFAIGKDVEGRPICGNVVKMKHMLVAGATGSGKSVCLNSLLISLICKYSPEDLRLILIDPKRIEFAVYAGLPHLMLNEIIAEPQKAVTALNWAIKEMERRYELFEKKTREERTTVRNIDEYNEHLGEDDDKLAKIVIVFDELADFMAVAKKDIEDRIQRLAAKARAAGIHLVLATQRPSVNVITGVIKGNLPTRFAFKVAAEVDSRTILDETGAQKLLGYGDLLYRSDDMFESRRVQGAYISSEEVQAIVDEIKAHNETYFDNAVSDYINKTEEAPDSADREDDDDGAELSESTKEMYIHALAIVVKLGQASISLIQRKCSVGYNHAGKIIEWMEAKGYISPFDGKAKARTVLLTPEEFQNIYGDIDQ